VDLGAEVGAVEAAIFWLVSIEVWDVLCGLCGRQAMSPIPLPDKFLQWFAPNHWPAIRRFQKFLGAPFAVTRELKKGVQTAGDHLEKFDLLVGLVNRLRPHLNEDLGELDRDGYTLNLRHKEFAALSEILFCELYSCLDGVRRTLYAVYKDVKGVQNQSTEKLFARAHSKGYGPKCPEEIRSALASAYATWFPELKRIRDAVTHGYIGDCRTDLNTGVIEYWRLPLEEGESPFLIEDVVEKVNDLSRSVLELTEEVFDYLYSRLESVERRVVCGTYMGRVYERIVAPEQNLSFDSGRCASRKWFETMPGLECPVRSKCGAFSANDSSDG
jgi:hypothetical protein